MKRFTYIAALVGMAALFLAAAAACGGDGNDEDAVRDTIREFAAAYNDRDFDRLAQLGTVNFFGFEPTAEAVQERFEVETASGFIPEKLENLEIVSVTVDGDKATATVTRTENGQTKRLIWSLVKVDDRWLVDAAAL